MTGGDGLGQSDPAQSLVELCCGRMLVAACQHRREPGDRRGLHRVDLDRGAPRGLGCCIVAGLREQLAEHGVRAALGVAVVARSREPCDLAPRSDGRVRITRREDRRGHLVDRRIVGGELTRRRELEVRVAGIVELVHEDVGEPQAELNGARDVGGLRSCA